MVHGQNSCSSCYQDEKADVGHQFKSVIRDTECDKSLDCVRALRSLSHFLFLKKGKDDF